MSAFQCKHLGCGAQLPRRVNFCPCCGALQAEPAPAAAPRQATAPSQRPTATVSAPPHRYPESAPARIPAKGAEKKPERRGGIGFWIVALALMFSVWLTFSDDKKPPPDDKLRHNAGQVKRK